MTREINKIFDLDVQEGEDVNINIGINLNVMKAGGGPASPWGNDFVLTAETTTASETFKLSPISVGSYDATVDWGDGTSSTITAWDDAGLTHTYATAGIYFIRIAGTFPSIRFDVDDRPKVRTVEQLGDLGWLRLDQSFNLCSNITKLHSGPVCETQDATSFASAFARLGDCDVDLSTLKTHSATNLSSILYLTLPSSSINVSGWNTSNVINMADAFRSTGNPDITGISAFDITGLSSGTRLARFLRGSSVSTEEYDATLIAWDAQSPVIPQTNANFGGSTYTAGGAAEAARTSLIGKGWVITDGGAA